MSSKVPEQTPTSAPVGVRAHPPARPAAEVPARDASGSRVLSRARTAAQSVWFQSACVLAVAACVRVAFLVRAHGMIDGDEAVLGMQAEQILRGAPPIYFASQFYLGVLASYLAAPFIALFGPTAWALRAVTIGESLVLVVLVGALAARLYGRRARLPAMLLSAVPTLYVAVGELHFWGGTIETMTLGSAALLLTAMLLDRATSGRPTLWAAASLGLVAGLAFWVTPLSLGYLIPAALWALVPAVGLLRRMVAGRSHALRRVCLGALVAALGALAGFSPALFYAAQTSTQNLAYLGWLLHGGTPTPGADPLRAGPLGFMLTRAVPRLTGSYPLWAPAPTPHLLQHIGLAFAAAAGIYTVARLAVRMRIWLDTRPCEASHAAAFRRAWNLALAPLVLALMCLMYWRSSYSDGYVVPQDITGRYLMPAAVPLTLMLASFFGDLPGILAFLGRRLHFRLSGGPSRATLVRVATVLALALLLAFNLVPYALADAPAAMQSPHNAGDLFPAVDGNIVTYLEQHHIHYVWANHWDGYVINYLADGRVIAADYIAGDTALTPSQRPRYVTERFPENLPPVEHADRPSYVIRADPAAGECAVARLLDSLHVSYQAIAFQHFWVITPLSRTVSPGELTPALLQGY